MRMDRESTLTAEYVVNRYSEEQLRRIFYEYGEEKWSARIARFIAEARKSKPLRTTLDLVEVINAAVPKSARQEGIHPATRTFQAIRIEVNGELEVLPGAIRESMGLLKPGGRLCILTFHSLEDRCVKQTFESFVNPCVCPRDFPVCMCGRVRTGKYIGKKMIIPSQEEIDGNPRARSAKLRVIQKV
jgi:16S rRNA (cytosine1402-N4)-methyltransferase